MMDLMRTATAIVVLSCISFAGGTLLSSAEHLTEAIVASFLDSIVQPPPRPTGFEELVPEQSIRINCIRPGGQFFQQVSLADGANIQSKIDFSRPITIITHGWTENSNLTQYQQMAERFRRFVPDINVCLLDWQPYATLTYQVAARQVVPLVAEHQSKFLLLLARFHYALEKVSLVGFSLGGQIVGLTGKALGGRIGAIFALDPAGPLFTIPRDVGPRSRLTRTDAKYVQVIATCRYELGVGQLIGTQNFLPNGGFHPQRSCVSLTVTGGEIREF
uniref:Uncharacterized protein n=1 Tax=Anopheles atroparvus TaxID=41427 RepID=A0A182IPT2_ANOAO